LIRDGHAILIGRKEITAHENVSVTAISACPVVQVRYVPYFRLIIFGKPCAC